MLMKYRHQWYPQLWSVARESNSVGQNTFSKNSWRIVAKPRRKGVPLRMPEEGKAFHYRMPKDSRFPITDPNLCKAAKFSLLWEMKDPDCVIENKMFWVLFELELCMVINQKPQLFPTLFKEYWCSADFKVDFHHVYIRARHNMMKKWMTFPFLVTEDDIPQLVIKWSVDWLLPMDVIECIMGNSA